VNADDAATFRAFVFGFLLRDEGVDPVVLYELQIFDHAHAVFCAIAFVQLFQSSAGLLAFKTELGFALIYRLAVFDPALNASKRLIYICCSAAGASIFVSQISHANLAVHAAGCDQLYVEFSVHSSSNRIMSII
jgi:hypothetical protein